MLLNFSDRTRTGAFNMIWPLAKEGDNFELDEGLFVDMHKLKSYAHAANTCHYILQHVKGKKEVPTAPRVPRRSPIQVLTGLDVA